MATLLRAPHPMLSLLALVAASLAAPTACGGDSFSSNSGDGGSFASGSSSSSGSSSASGGIEGSGGNHGGGNAATGGSASGGASSSGGAEGTGSGSSVDGSCDNTAQCTLAGRTCCPLCTLGELSDYQALNVDQLDAHEKEICAGARPPCEACVEFPPNPNFFATCDSGTCTAHDLRTHEAARCIQDEDCIITPAACCDCNAGNGPEDIVAINHENVTAFREAQCATASTSICGKCAWIPPEKLTAKCVDLSCAVTDAAE